MLLVIHGVEQLVFVDEAADGEVDEAEEADDVRAGEDTVHDSDYEDEDCLWERKAVAERGGLVEAGVVAGCARAKALEWIKKHTAKFEKTEGEKP